MLRETNRRSTKIKKGQWKRITQKKHIKITNYNLIEIVLWNYCLPFFRHRFVFLSEGETRRKILAAILENNALQRALII